MKLRMNYREAKPEAYRAMQGLEAAAGRGLDPLLKELVKTRVSQMNGCAFCVDMHSKDLLGKGEPAERLLLLPVWREVPAFTEAERAALAFAERAAFIADGGMPEDVYEEAVRWYGEAGVVDLLLVVNTIGAWNRIAIATGMYPGCFDGPIGKGDGSGLDR
ncbi:carboxymuconolactone decarboxylase family protein [Paenibacillus albicereus]|uniref:Carboxymuconolactone decarboxylase family protein n=1 Tax=Paenibacillus albicereus TaxID=2726185 RepID=A0A6H2H2G4_9BACL|nr:carboxymuconolactone decarboxylase family protein [Paenibacillus albicereus]QJC53789.1 carboxymuconolactone decarboxylase family protein [Paenibacillus albicereus]